MKTPISIDGSYGEGGGQILRTALALSALLQAPFEIHHIRAGRKKPGLAPQHLMAVKAVADITSAEVQGAEIGSGRFVFRPRELKAGSYRFDIGTAGSTSLVLQAVLPGLAFSDTTSTITIKGGTHVPWSPSFHYLRDVFVPSLSELGPKVSLEIRRWGWFPRGGGEIRATIHPCTRIAPTEKPERGEMKALNVLSAAGSLPISIAERQRDRALKVLARRGYPSARGEALCVSSASPGTVVFVKAGFRQGRAGFTSLGQRGKSAEKVAEEACDKFLQFMASDGSIDRHLSDQLVLYLSLAQGRSFVALQEVTRHLETNIWVIQQFLPMTCRIDRERRKLTVEGIGFQPGKRFQPDVQPD
jgi:RNA 3'-terminal phosphate cyclase (ATP)